MKTIQKEICNLVKECDFEHYGIFPVDKLLFRSEVRDMCRANTCGKYGKTWTCPPAVPDLDVIARQAAEYTWGIVIQTTAQLEDEFDVETMLEAMAVQNERFALLCARLKETQMEFMPMSSNGCEICPKCTYPSSPCRFPEKAVISMEAYGLVVSDVCKAAGILYYYGPNTLTYSSCILFRS